MAYNPYQIIEPVRTPVITTPAPISTTVQPSEGDKKTLDALSSFINSGLNTKPTDSADPYATADRARYNDLSLGYLPTRDNENYYEQNQSAWNMAGNMFKQALAINNAQYINTMATTLDFNLSNDLDKEAVAEMHNTMQNSMNENPVYRSSEDTFSAGFQNFIGETIPQIGFMTGTAGAIITQELALQGAAMALDATGVGLPAGITAHLAGIGKGVKTFNDAYKAWSGFKALKTTAQLLKGARGVKAIELMGITGKVAKAAYMSHIAASSEAAVEGYDAKLRAQDYWATQAQKEINETGKTDLTYEEIEKRGNEVGYKVLYDNYKMLIATNAVALAQWAPGVKSAVNSVQRTLFGTGVRLGEDSLLQLGGKTVLGKIRNWTNFVASPLIEGMEEYNQGVIQEGVYNYYKDKYDPELENTSRSLSSYYGDIWKERWSDPQALKEFASGALIGSIGSGGGAIRNFTGDKLAETKFGRSAIGRNLMPTSDKYNLKKQVGDINKAYSESGLNQQAFLNHMFNSVLEKQKAIDNGDLKTAKDIEDTQKINFYRLIIQNGALDLYTEALTNIGKLSKQEFIDQYGIDTTIMDPDTLNNFDPAKLVSSVVGNLEKYKNTVGNITSFINNKDNFSILSDIPQEQLIRNKNRINFLPYKNSDNPFLAKMAASQEDAIFVLADLAMQAEHKAERFTELESQISDKVPFISSISTNEFFNDVARNTAIQAYTEELNSLKAISTDPAALLTSAPRMRELTRKLDVLNRLKTFQETFSPSVIDNTENVATPSNFDLFSRLSSNGRITRQGSKSKIQNRNKTDKNYEYVKNLWQEYLNLESEITGSGNLSVNDVENIWLESLDTLSLYDENQNLLRTYNKLLNPSAFNDFTNTLNEFKDKADKLAEEEAKNEAIRIEAARRAEELEREKKERETASRTETSGETTTRTETVNPTDSNSRTREQILTDIENLPNQGVIINGDVITNSPELDALEKELESLEKSDSEEDNSPTEETMEQNAENVQASKTIFSEMSQETAKQLALEAENGNALDFLNEFSRDFNENCK